MTPEQIRERDQRHAAEAAETRARHDRLVAAAWDDGVVMIVIDHHAPVIDGGYRECRGCDFTGAEAEPPEYPCSTIELLEQHYGLTA